MEGKLGAIRFREKDECGRPTGKKWLNHRSDVISPRITPMNFLNSFSMLPLALSAFEKAGKVPSSFWLKVVLVFAGIFLFVAIMRKLLEVNKFIFIAVGLVAVAVLGFNWIYERNEPEFLTPVIDRIAPFFPTKGAYQVRQASDPTPGAKQKPKH
jgi:hypothetical protein